MISKRVMIAEAGQTGHRLMYVRLLVEAALRKGWNVVLFLGFDEKSSDEYATHLGDLEAHFEVVNNATINLKTIRRQARSSAADHVVVPTGDRIGLELGRTGWWVPGCRISVLVLRDPGNEFSSNAIRNLRLSLKAALLFRAGTLPRVLIFRLRSVAHVDVPGRSRYIADPVVIKRDLMFAQHLRQTWGLREDIFWFGVVGAISSRKNIPLVLDALEKLNRTVGLLIAGQSNDQSFPSAHQVCKLLAAGVTVVQVPRTLSDLEMDSAVAMVDCVAILHSNEGPSGILGKAGALGTRVIAGGARSLKRDIDNLGTGQWVPLEVDKVTLALDCAMRSISPLPNGCVSSTEFLRLLQ